MKQGSSSGVLVSMDVPGPFAMGVMFVGYNQPFYISFPVDKDILLCFCEVLK